MIDRQHIPLIIFGVCVVMALALAFLTGAWPAALAVALSGCALALAMRPAEVEDHDTAFLEEDIADIRKLTETQEADIAALRGSIDEVADIVESIATDIHRLDGDTTAADVGALRMALDGLDQRVTALDAPAAQTAARLDAMEQGLQRVQARPALQSAQVEPVENLQPVEPVALAVSGGGMAAAGMQAAAMAAPQQATAKESGSITERAGRLRDRFTRSRKPRQVSAMPLFDAGRAPCSLLIDDPAEGGSVEGSIAAIRHALDLIGASDDTDSRIFVRIPGDIVAHADFAIALESVLSGENLTAAPRLVALIPQSAVKGGPPRALALLLEAGVRFGLEHMTDWSADLDTLAKRGLTVIAVDGPAMAKSAMSQKGDPTRLRQVLHARGIELLTAGVETRIQLDAVSSLVPDLLAGPGLGEATLMEAPE